LEVGAQTAAEGLSLLAFPPLTLALLQVTKTLEITKTSPENHDRLNLWGKYPLTLPPTPMTLSLSPKTSISKFVPAKIRDIWNSSILTTE